MPFGEIADFLSGALQIFNILFICLHTMLRADYLYIYSNFTFEIVYGQLKLIVLH